VEIARALVIRPRLLLLDEPSAGMNLGEKDALITLIRWIHKEFNLTIWLIEHEMKVVMNLCKAIQVLEFGETIAEGTPEQIFELKSCGHVPSGNRSAVLGLRERSGADDRIGYPL
jgi:branched-chain amino acid transport system ATP-binding protein